QDGSYGSRGDIIVRAKDRGRQIAAGQNFVRFAIAVFNRKVAVFEPMVLDLNIVFRGAGHDPFHRRNCMKPGKSTEPARSKLSGISRCPDETDGTGRGQEMKKATISVLQYGVLTLYSLFIILPIVWLGLTSVKTNKELYVPS